MARGFLHPLRQRIVTGSVQLNRFRRHRVQFTNGGTPYDQWASANGIFGASGTADNDNDGVLNLYEYGFNGNPTDGLVPANLPALTKSGDGFVYVYPKRSDDTSITYTVKTTTNLVSGTWAATGYT